MSSPLYYDVQWYEVRKEARVVRFAKRTDWAAEETAWSRALEARRRSGLPILDLTARRAYC